MNDTLTGKIIDGKYKVLELLGRGGMAEVYKAHQENLDRHVAIKFMHAFLVEEADFLHRFKREARAMAALNHPNIVSIYDFDVYGDNSYYLVMEYIEGGTLKDHLETLAALGERMPVTEAVRIATEVADALAYAHGRGMIHRDIKPANIMISEAGQAILTDFGIVKLLGGESIAYTATGALIGTPAYMSPEQALGQQGDERVDIYSLGVLLFQMATSQLPFAADTPLGVVMKHVNEPAPLPVHFNPNIPNGLQQVILKALAKDPAERFQTAADMAKALRAVRLDGATTVMTAPPAAPEPGPTMVLSAVNAVDSAEVIAGNTTATTETASPTRRRSVWLFAGAGLLLLLLLGGIARAAGFFGSGGSEPTPPAGVAAAKTATTTTTADATTPTPPPDIAATVFAGIALTEAAEPTSTLDPTHTATATPTPTANATATFLASCVPEVELVVAERQGRATNAVTTGVPFTIQWTLRNSGACPWPSDLQWTYVSGAEFEYEGTAIPLEKEVAAGEEIVLTADFIAPDNPGTYEGNWQLVDADGNAFGSEQRFEIRAFAPATATPVPTNTPPPAPTVTATTVASEPVNWIFVVQRASCEYTGRTWRCPVTITPYGGGGGPYTVWVFDGPQPAEYRGSGPFTHFAGADRCRAYNPGAHGVKVQDDATGTSVTGPMYIDPHEYFEGGCVE